MDGFQRETKGYLFSKTLTVFLFPLLKIFSVSSLNLISSITQGWRENVKSIPTDTVILISIRSLDLHFAFHSFFFSLYRYKNICENIPFGRLKNCHLKMISKIIIFSLKAYTLDNYSPEMMPLFHLEARGKILLFKECKTTYLVSNASSVISFIP